MYMCLHMCCVLGEDADEKGVSVFSKWYSLTISYKNVGASKIQNELVKANDF